MELRDYVRREFDRRVQRNPRYSLRAFARALGTHHTTLSRVLDGRRRLSRTVIDRIGARLALAPNDVASARAAEDAKSILELTARPDFRPDCRWIATMTSIDLDDVNRALHLLIYERRLVMRSATSWSTTRA